MGLCDFLLGSKFEIGVRRVELGEHHIVEPHLEYVSSPTMGEDLIKIGTFIPKPAHAYFDIKVSASVVPLDKPFLSFDVERTYRSCGVNPDLESRNRERSRLEQEIRGINRLIQEEGITLQTRVRAEIPPVAVTSDSQYAKDVGGRLPKNLYDMIVDYVTEKGAVTSNVESHG